MDPYKVLGIDPGAPEEEIKKAYKKLALEWHPDRHGGDSKAEEKFKEISAAYQILTGKLKQPNQGFPPGFGPGTTDEELFEFFRGHTGFSFGDVFTPFAHRTQAQVRLSMQLPLEEICAGGQKTVRFVKQSGCHNCSGLGHEISKEACPTCGGAGRSISSAHSVFKISMTCQACRGTGKKLGSLCSVCRGICTISTQHETTVNIPPGILDGETIAAADGSHVTVHYKEHPVFKIVPRTLNTESEIETSLFDLLLGGEAAVQTLVGEMRVKIDPSLRPGSRLRIRGAGMLGRQGNRGDHVVRIWARMPKLTEDHLQALRKIRVEAEGESDDSKHS